MTEASLEYLELNDDRFLGLLCLTREQTPPINVSWISQVCKRVRLCDILSGCRDLVANGKDLTGI